MTLRLLRHGRPTLALLLVLVATAALVVNRYRPVDRDGALRRAREIALKDWKGQTDGLRSQAFWFERPKAWLVLFYIPSRHSIDFFKGSVPRPVIVHADGRCERQDGDLGISYNPAADRFDEVKYWSTWTNGNVSRYPPPETWVRPGSKTLVKR
jgi:hypothetical protein